MRRSDVELTDQPEDQRAVKGLLRHLEVLVIELAHETSSPADDSDLRSLVETTPQPLTSHSSGRVTTRDERRATPDWRLRTIPTWPPVAATIGLPRVQLLARREAMSDSRRLQGAACDRSATWRSDRS